jgi:hypothetical protein
VVEGAGMEEKRGVGRNAGEFTAYSRCKGSVYRAGELVKEFIPITHIIFFDLRI